MENPNFQRFQCTFKRIEKKYTLTRAQAERLLDRLQTAMRPDEFGLHGVANIYYDTPDYALIRASVEKPAYKEKFRLRGYSTPGEENILFAELKKKYKGVVYKRRIAADPAEMTRFLSGEMIAHEDAQSQREIHHFLGTHPIAPRAFIGYDRIALVGRQDSSLRVTLDHHIRWRQDRLRLSDGRDGALVLADDPVVMEIKIAGAAPLWLARMLSEEHIYPTSFSKYGMCYLAHIAPHFAQALARNACAHHTAGSGDAARSFEPIGSHEGGIEYA